MNDCVNRDALNALSDEALVSLVSSQPLALQTLIARYEQTVYHTANSLGQSATEAEDFAEEGLLGLLAAISAYSAQKNASFCTFANCCIRNRIRSACRKNGTLGVRSSISLDDPDRLEQEMLRDDQTPEQIYLEKERISALYRKMDAVLTGLEREMFCLYLSGASYAEMAAQKGVSQKVVGNAIWRARRKLRVVWSEPDCLSGEV